MVLYGIAWDCLYKNTHALVISMCFEFATEQSFIRAFNLYDVTTVATKDDSEGLEK